MTFDLKQTDALLSTTRAVRRRLDLDRDVPDELLLDCIDLAEQAPSGGNVASRRWMVIRDPETKTKLAELYRAAGGSAIIERAEGMQGTGHPRERVSTSAAYLAENMEQIPALVLVTVWGVHDGRRRPGLYDSVIQAAWSFCLALRSRGLGSAWTTIHLGRDNEVAELLGIPDGVSQVVLLPVAWTIGTEFRPVARKPASQITFFDTWGHTKEYPADGRSLLDTQPGVTVEVDIDASPERVWELVSDINVPARFSTEFVGAEWVDSDGPRLGASFTGRNAREDRQWQTTCYVVACDPSRAFAWNVGNPDEPSAMWRFDLEAIGDGTRLRQHMNIGTRRSGTSRAMEEDPGQAEQILARRRDQLRRNMELTTQGIKGLAEERT